MLFIKYVLGTILACLLLSEAPELYSIIIIVWGVLLLLSALDLSRGQLIIIHLLNLIVLFSLIGAEMTWYYIASCGLSVFAMTIAIINGKKYYEVCRWGLLASIVGITIYIGGIYFVDGGFDTEGLKLELNHSFQDAIRVYEEQGVFERYGEYGISKETVSYDFKTLAEKAAEYLPSFFYIHALLNAFLIVYLTARFSKRKSNKLIKKAFTQEIMPWELVWVVILSLALWLWGGKINSLLYAVGSNTLIIMIPVAAYFGLSVACWWIKNTRIKFFGIIMIVAIMLSLLLFVSAFIFLALLGLFDALLDYRKLRSLKGETA